MNAKEKVLEYSYNIFKHYFGDFKLKRLYKSPLRQEKRPSFNIYVGKQGLLLFKDFGYASGNAIDFVSEKYRVSFSKAIEMIIKDLNIPIEYKGISTDRKKAPKKIKIEKKERPRLRPIVYKYNGKPIYTEADKKYWLRDLKIKNINLLVKHNVWSTKELLINNFRVWSYTEENPIYTYVEKYKGEFYFKSYRPLDKNGDKWRSDYVDAIRMIHGLNLLKYNTKELIITKSNKDSIILDSLGFNVINTQGEDMPFPKDIMDKLKNIYDDIYVFYDCDYNKEENTGYILGEKLAREHKLKQILMPGVFECTDTGELISKFNRETVFNLINKWKSKAKLIN